jgi:hypothetical protein
MPKKAISIIEKITQSENKIKQLIEQRNKELLDIITKFNAISIDDKLLAGFLLFTLNPANKDHHILKEFKELVKQTKSPSKPK